MQEVLALGVKLEEEMMSARLTGMTNQKCELAKVCIYQR